MTTPDVRLILTRRWRKHGIMPERKNLLADDRPHAWQLVRVGTRKKRTAGLGHGAGRSLYAAFPAERRVDAAEGKRAQVAGYGACIVYLYYEEKTIPEKKPKISISFSNIHTQDHWKSFQLKTICGNKEWKSTESSIKSEEK